jgi:signal transduction histidine kinase
LTGSFRSLRARILLLVIALMLPLGVVGWWLTHTASRSGQQLVRARLAQSLEQAAGDLGAQWVPYRSALLSLGESAAVQESLIAGRDELEIMPAQMRTLEAAFQGAVERLAIRDTSGRIIWSHTFPLGDPIEEESFAGGVLPVRLAIFERVSGRELGSLDLQLRVAMLRLKRAAAASVVGSVLTVLDPASSVALLPTPFDRASLRLTRFRWAGDDWLTERRSVAEPRLDFVAAAALSPFTQPFEHAARRGLWLLLAVTATGMLLAAGFSSRMTRALTRLASAADAVARGDLNQKAEAEGTDEVARVGRAFNTMTVSLERTVDALAQREALAAVGSFASELAHEVRNPLTSIRVDLQLVDERLPADSPLREIQRGALAEIERLDRTVAGVLRLARSGTIELQPLDLMEMLGLAARAAAPQFVERGATLRVESAAVPVMVRGDASALVQLFLNLLLNAAQASIAGGQTVIGVATDDRNSIVTVRDDGMGMSPDLLAKVREPFFSTKTGGTGLGLAIAGRIVQAHAAELRIESTINAGTTVTVILPLLHAG